MRTQYETKTDNENEIRLAFEIERIFSLEAKKLPRKYKQFDRALVRNDKDMVAFAELKCRKNSHDHYETYMISLDKWMYGIQLTQATGLRSIIFIQFTDGVYAIDVENVDGIYTEWGGRTVKRRDWEDEEPMIHIPHRLLNKIS
jgi:hypothetical protein